MILYMNIIGSGRPTYNLPAYIDLGLRTRSGRSHMRRIYLPRRIFRNEHLYRIEKG